MIFDMKKDVIIRRTDTKVVLSVAAGWPNIPTSKCLTIRFFKRSKVKKSAFTFRDNHHQPSAPVFYTFLKGMYHGICGGLINCKT